jgi:hypothetical protein
MKLPNWASRWLMWIWLLLAAGGTMAVSGCKTTQEADNDASIPWNTPKSWEHSLPGGMGQRQ